MEYDNFVLLGGIRKLNRGSIQESKQHSSPLDSAHV